MKIATVCKNFIAQNNKKGWVNPTPTIRLTNTPSGKVQARAHAVKIVDKDGNTVASLVATKDGEKIISCGAKVALFTKYPMEVMDG